MKEIHRSLFLSFLVIVFLFIGGEALAADKITLNCVSSSTTAKPEHSIFMHWIDSINERAKGELIIRYRGGPEVMNMAEIHNAVKNGTIQVGLSSSGNVSRMVPEANANSVSRMSSTETRHSGYFDLMQKVFLEKANLVYLGHMGENMDFVLGLRDKKVDSLEDLKGLRFSTTPFFTAFLKELGVSPVGISRGEVRDALQRGIVDGYPRPLATIWQQRTYENTKYVIDHAYYQGGPNIAFMNSDSWNALPDHLKKIVIEASIDAEIWAAEKNKKDLDEAYSELPKHGVEFLKFSQPQAKAYLNAAYETQWADIIKKSPNYGSQLKKLCDPYADKM